MQKGIKIELMQSVLEHFDMRIPVTEEVMKEIATNLNVEKFRRGDLITHPNDSSVKWYFVEEGLVRLYYYRENEQITSMFFSEGSCINIFERYYFNQPTKYYIEAIEPSKIYSLEREDGERLRDKYSSVAELHRKLLAKFLLLEQEHLDLLKFETAEARYDSLMRRVPHILLRTPSIYIASYLGLTPETLSRIRARKAKQIAGNNCSKVVLTKD